MRPLQKPVSPGLRATQAARRVAIAALYWGPILFLLATLALVVGLWTGMNVGGIVYVVVAVLAAAGVAAAWTLQRRLGEISFALERAQRTSTVGLLTAGFAHEMKNALTVILGFAELARTSAEKLGSDPKVTRHLKEVENETRRTVGQLQTFLSYASGERAQRLPRDANELCRDALTMIRPMARMKELKVDEDTGDPPRIVCDPFAVRQLLLNLLLNALDFARTRIVVATRAADGWAELVVSDDGPGVPPEDRQRIFRRFVTTRPGGNGLGLSTSREIAEAHGGSLTLSETPGGGATFIARLPGAPSG